MKIRTFEIAAFFAFIICVFLSTYNFDKSCEGIRENVLRLHVVAASDSREDQEIKLMLRDELLEKGAEIFSLSETKKEAQTKISENIKQLQECAESFLEKSDYPCEVTVSLGKSYFPTRRYDSFTLPAGIYDALKVVIGPGEGENWWCVMFPALCLPAATQSDKGFEAVLTKKQIEIVNEEGYEIRLWLVEKWQEIKNMYNN